MGIYQRPDSVFWWMLIERAGQKPLRLSTGFPIEGGSINQTKALKQSAQEAYATQMGDLARRRFRLPESYEGRTFAQHRAWYAAHVSTQKRGTTREHSMLTQLGAFFDRYDLSAIDHALAREWRTARLANVSASTVRREEALLKHLLTTAVPKYLERNSLTGFRRLRVEDTDTRVLSRDEERRLLAALTTPEDRALVIGALDTLLRLSNMKNLTRPQDHGTYLFSDAKAGAVRIPISRRLRRALDALPTNGRAFFPTYAAHQGNNHVIRMFMAACARAHVPTGRKVGGVSFHCLRHTGATRMLAAGVDVKTVMTIGGWKNLKVMERYLHPTDADARRAVNAIGPKRKRPKR